MIIVVKIHQNGMHVDYFRKTNEFLFFCSYSGIRISIIKFDEDGNEISTNNNIKYYISGYGLFSYSILMLSTFSHYSIIYTWNDQNSFRYLLSKEFNPLVIYNTSDNSVALTIDIIDTNNTKCSEYSNGDVKCLYRN